jgi:hypothetical protein
MPAEYNWPQKVRRYQITCPFQRILVAKYEAQIEWNKRRIQSPEALDAHIREVMLPKLQSWISPDHPESHYCKTVNLSRMLANPAPHIAEAQRIAEQKGEDAARAFLLAHINNQKKEQFDAWWDYVTRENPLYSRHPAFQYLLLRPVFESSTAKHTRSPLALDRQALAQLFDHMASGEIAPAARLLPLLGQIMAFGRTTEKNPVRFGSNCDWVIITSKDDNAAARVAALSQKSGWCVASVSMAESYLKSSDFHLLVESGRAVAALRFSGERENIPQNVPFLVEEIRGKWNRDLGPWWPWILLHIAAHDGEFFSRKKMLLWLDFGAHSAQRRLQAQVATAAKTPKKLASLLRKQPSLVHLLPPARLAELDPDQGPEHDPVRLIVEQAWAACLRADPACYPLLPRWMQDSEMRENLIQVWLAKLAAHPLMRVPESLCSDERIQTRLKAVWLGVLKTSPRIWTRCPQEILQSREAFEVLRPRWAAILERDVWAWKSCPDFLRQDEVVLSALETAWIHCLRKDPLLWVDCPPLIQKNPATISAAESGWCALLRLQPRSWIQCPPFLRSREHIKKSLHAGWAQLLTRDPRAYPNCPPSAKKLPVVLSGLQSGWVTLLKRNPADWNYCPEFILRRTPVMEALEEGWCSRLARNPRAWTECPARILSRRAVKMTLATAWLGLLRTAPTSWAALPPALKSLPEIQAAHKAGWILRLAHDPKAWNLCPESLRQDPELHESMVSGWLQILPADPQAGKHMPPDLGSNPKIEEALRRSWIDLLHRAPRAWAACPADLRSQPAICTARKLGWITLLKNSPQSFFHLPMELRSDPEIVPAVPQEPPAPVPH